MNIRQLQYEISAIELLSKYAPIIDAIMTMTENVGIMNEYDRKKWIENHALRVSPLSEINYVVVEEIVTGQATLSSTHMGLNDSSMGVELQKSLLQTTSFALAPIGVSKTEVVPLKLSFMEIRLC